MRFTVQHIRNGALCIGLVIPVWFFFVTPALLSIPSNFSYRADIDSHDNFYDESKGQYSGKIKSKTQFYYEVVSKQEHILLVKNVFDVRKPTGERIFSVERLYGIDPKTGKHVEAFGDENRSGYLFAPRHVKKGQDFTYWHINYDAPALMKFTGEENILGLKVYRYEAAYMVDQTKNLGTLPGVPDKRGVNLDIDLKTWVEPVTGRMIKYQDATTAYFYDSKTKQRLHPWNQFGNTLTDASVADQVRITRFEIFKTRFIENIVPIFFGLVSVVLLVISFKQNKSTSV